MCASTCCLRLFAERNKHLVELISALIAMAISLIVIWLSFSYVMQSWSDRRRLRQSRRHSGALHAQERSSRSASRCCFVQSLAQAIRLLSRLAEGRLMPFNELLALLMLVSFFVLLMAGIPVALTLATAGLGVRLYRLRAAAVQPAAEPHLRRGDELHADRHAAVRVHGRDAGEIAAGRRPDGGDRRTPPAICAAAWASASSSSAC